MPELFIGPHAITSDGNVRTIAGIQDHRLTATCPHLKDPAGMVLVLGMEGEFWEVDVKTLEARLLADLRKELGLPADARPHFKGAWTHHGRVVIANNTFTEADARGEPSAGRLAEWDGTNWKVLERASLKEVFATEEFSKPMICIGYDAQSAILMVHADGRWMKYRLPRHGHAWDETSTTTSLSLGLPSRPRRHSPGSEGTAEVCRRPHPSTSGPTVLSRTRSRIPAQIE